MSLTAGTRLGPYEIIAAIGAGGMGDVYKARDTRLDRTVAIKVVRTDFSERFEREARSISALNHPNICTLHDVGQQDGTAYLVMEFVDGAPIAGPLPVADVIKYGIQICEALDAAHRKAIIHRDLKPANILATKSGIKLLDFGLAKLQPAAPGAPGAPGNEATVAALTGAHTIVGTPQYMAPEQIEGRDADPRTDIFALGCVLYELITGKRAFEGKTSSNVMAAVLATEPRRISELVPVTPPALEWVVLRCLEKDPDARWQNARDVALQLKWIADHPAELQGTASGSARGRGGLLAGLVIGAVVAGLGVGAWFWSRPGTIAPESAPVSLSMRLPDKISLAPGVSGSSIAVSPDGRTIAFAGFEDAIYLRALDRFDAVRVTGTEGGGSPFFSPNGRWLGFNANGELRKIPIAGGASVPICDAQALRGVVWLADDTIVFSPEPTGGLMRVSSDGGTPTQLTSLDPARQERTHRTLISLPGGKTVVFVVGSNEIATYDDARIVALTLETGKITELVKGGYAPLFSPTGHLLYVHNSAVFAVPLDPVTLKVGGSPVQVLKDVATQPSYGNAELYLAPNGVLAFATGGNQSERDSLLWVDRKGSIQAIPLAEGQYFDIAMSPNGRLLSFGVAGANNVLWTYDLERNQPTRVTFRFDAQAATWTPDGLGLTYWSATDVRTIATDGSGREEILISASEAAGHLMFPLNWSRDGDKLAVSVFTRGKGDDISIYSKRDKRLVPVAATRFDESKGWLSPDGRWLAYTSNESGRGEIYLKPLDGTGARYPVTNDGGFFALWTKDGHELVYASQSGVRASSFSSGAQGSPPVLGKPEVLFPGAKLDGAIGLAAAPDGKRFVVLMRKPPTPLNEINVVLNWTQTLAPHWR